MSKLSTLTSRGRFLGAAAALLLTTAASALVPTLAGAEQVANRSLSLTSSAPGNVGVTDAAGSATNGQKVGYTFTFDAATAGNFQSWNVMFCRTAFGYYNTTGERPITTGTSSDSDEAAPCSTPTGMTTVNAPNPIVTVDGSTVSGWTTTVDAARPNVIQIAGASAATVAVGDVVTIEFAADGTNFITNPTVATSYIDVDNAGTGFENTFFGHMNTYSDAAWTTRVDEGTVTSATTESVNLVARVQETLKFSVGTTATAVGTACSALSGNATLTLGDTVNGALSSTRAYDAQSFFRTSTNATAGADINYAGKTLTSGTRTVAALTNAATVNNAGTEQFGLALNTTDSEYSFTSLAPVAAYAGGSGSLSTAAGVAGTATFAFDTTSDGAPKAIASTVNPVACDTGTVRYVANISDNTASGIYKTSINYIAVPRY